MSLPKGSTFHSRSVHLAAQSTAQMARQRIRIMVLIPFGSTDLPDPARRDRFYLLFACAERSRSIRITSPRRSSCPPSGGRNDLLGSSCECFTPLAGKIAAHLWAALYCEMVLTRRISGRTLLTTEVLLYRFAIRNGPISPYGSSSQTYCLTRMYHF